MESYLVLLPSGRMMYLIDITDPNEMPIAYDLSPPNVLRIIGDTYGASPNLSGLIYMHRLIDWGCNRQSYCTKQAQQWKELLGGSFFGLTIVTVWRDGIGLSTSHRFRNQDWMEEYWRHLEDQGAKVFRYGDDIDWRMEIIHHFDSKTFMDGLKSRKAAGSGNLFETS